MKKKLLMTLSVMTVLCAVFAMSSVVFAGAPQGPGNASANASSNSGWVTETDSDNGADARAGALVGETSSGSAQSSSSSTVNNGSADAYSSTFIGWDSSGNASADAVANASNYSEADADAFAWIILGSNGTADATALADASDSSEADADSFAKLREGASGSVDADSKAIASDDGYADANARAVLIGTYGNLVSWAWATAAGQGSDAYSHAGLTIGETEGTYIGPVGPDESGPIREPAAPLAPGVFFDYGISDSSYGIALLVIVDPTNIYSFAISNAVGGTDAWATADIEGNHVLVDAGAGKIPH